MHSVRNSALVVVLSAMASAAAAQQPEKKPEQPRADSAKVEAKAETAGPARVEAKAAGDVTPATATQLLGSISEASATATSLASATITDVRLVGSAEVLDAAGSAALGLLVTKHDAELVKLRQAAAQSAPIKAALQAGNVSSDRVIGVAINGTVVTVFHRSQ